MGVISKAIASKRRYKTRVLDKVQKHELDMAKTRSKVDEIKAKENTKTQRTAAWAAAVAKSQSDRAHAQIEQAQQLTARTKEIEATKRAMIQYNSLMNGNQNKTDAKGETNKSNENSTTQSNSDLWV